MQIRLSPLCYFANWFTLKRCLILNFKTLVISCSAVLTQLLFVWFCMIFILLFHPVQDSWLRLAKVYFLYKVFYYKMLFKIYSKSLFMRETLVLEWCLQFNKNFLYGILLRNFLSQSNFKNLYQGIVETICRPFRFNCLLNVSQHKF